MTTNNSIATPPSSAHRPHRHGLRAAPSTASRPGLLVLCGLLCALALGLGACGPVESSPSDERPSGPVPAVEAVPARTGALPLEERLSGLLRARNQVAIRPQISAPVEEVLVTSGQAVTRDQPLVRLRDDTLREQLRQSEASARLAAAAADEARARLAELEAQARRNRVLAEEDLISQVELETLEARVEGAQASLAQAEARTDEARATVLERRAALDRAVVRSPLSGRLGQRRVEVGMQVDPGTVLFEVGDLDELMVEVPVTESMLAFIEEGQPVLVEADSLGGEPVRATVSRISPFLQEGSFSTVAEIDLPNPGDRLRPGMFVDVAILYGQSREATLVPTTSLWEDPTTGEMAVYVVTETDGLLPEGGGLTDDPRRLERRAAEVIAEGRASVGIAGVEEGEWVVTLGQHLLGGGEEARARVRPVVWDTVVGLQSIQREDLLEGFLAKQRRLAESIGARPPDEKDLVQGSVEPTVADPTAEGTGAEGTGEPPGGP